MGRAFALIILCFSLLALGALEKLSHSIEENPSVDPFSLLSKKELKAWSDATLTNDLEVLDKAHKRGLFESHFVQVEEEEKRKKEKKKKEKPPFPFAHGVV
jgi:hypothetical protein